MNAKKVYEKRNCELPFLPSFSNPLPTFTSDIIILKGGFYYSSTVRPTNLSTIAVEGIVCFPQLSRQGLCLATQGHMKEHPSQAGGRKRKKRLEESCNFHRKAKAGWASSGLANLNNFSREGLGYKGCV